MAEPGFQCQGAVEHADGNVFVAPGFLQCLRKSVRVYDPDGAAGDVLPYLREVGRFFGATFRRLLGNSLSLLSVQDFIGDDADKSTFHQGTALADADDLFPGDSEHEFQKVSVKKGKEHLMKKL